MLNCMQLSATCVTWDSPVDLDSYMEGVDRVDLEEALPQERHVDTRATMENSTQSREDLRANTKTSTKSDGDRRTNTKKSTKSREDQRSDTKTSSKSLASEAPAPIVRGVPLRTCLSGWAAAFASNKPDLERSYTLSQITPTIDAFLSHDWKTPRWSKACALLLLFNALPAAVTSMTASILLSGMLALGWLPGGWPTASAVFWLGFGMFESLLVCLSIRYTSMFERVQPRCPFSHFTWS